MKKIILTLIIMLLFSPLIVNAAEITSKSLNSVDSISIGDTFYVSFRVKYSDVKKGTTDTLGVGAVAFEIIFDDSILSIVEISSDNEWDTNVYKDDGKYYVMSTVTADNRFKNKCVDEVLNCIEYLSTLKFFVKETDKKNFDIEMGDTEVLMYPVNSEYLDSDAIILESTDIESINIKIKDKEVETIEKVEIEPPSVVSNENKQDIISKVENNIENSNINSSSKNKDKEDKNNESQISDFKNSNNYLNSLEIKDYKLKFDKDKLDYKLYVDHDVNTLEINAVPSNKESIVNIIGADDIKGHNNVILIEVIAPNGSKRNYNINIKYNINIDELNNNSDDIEDVKKSKFKIDKKIIKIGILVFIGIIVISIIIGIINYLRNRKLNKMLDDFDKL